MSRTNLARGFKRIPVLHDVERVNLALGCNRVALESPSERVSLAAGDGRIDLHSEGDAIVGVPADPHPGMTTYSASPETHTPATATVTTTATLEGPQWPASGYRQVAFRFTDVNTGVTFTTGWSKAKANPTHSTPTSLSGSIYIERTYDRIEYSIREKETEIVIYDWAIIAGAYMTIQGFETEE